MVPATGFQTVASSGSVWPRIELLSARILSGGEEPMTNLCSFFLMICLLPTLCWAGQALHWPVHEYPAIDMVIGTYGDARISNRDVQFHPGIDLHRPGGTQVFAVKSHLKVERTLKVDPPMAGAGHLLHMANHSLRGLAVPDADARLPK